MVPNSNLSFFRSALLGLAFAVAFVASAGAQPKTAASPTATVKPAKSDDELLTESPKPAGPPAKAKSDDDLLTEPPKPAGSPGATKSDEDLLTEPGKSADDEILDPLQLPVLVPNGPIEAPPEELSPLKKQLPGILRRKASWQP